MKKSTTLRLPNNDGANSISLVTVSVAAPTSQVANRLLAYVEQFEAAETLVLGFRGKTTQLVEIWADENTPIESMYRCWIGSQFAGTVLAKCEEDAQKAMRRHLLSCGYTRHALRYLTVRPAVHKWPTKAFIKHLEGQTP